MRFGKVAVGGEEKDLTQIERQASKGSCFKREYWSWSDVESLSESMEREEEKRRPDKDDNSGMEMKGRCLRVFLRDII